MSPARYLAIVFGSLVALLVAWAVYAASEFDRYTRSGYASCAYIETKINLASAIPSPKLVVVAGSSAALGIDTGAIAKAFSTRAFNFALVATFSPGFQLFEAKKTLKPGDAVLLAFEYLAYEYQTPTNGLVDTVYSCGRDYWESLDWPRRLFFIFAIRPQRYFSTRAIDPASQATVRDTVASSVNATGDIASPSDTPGADAATHQPLLIRLRTQSNGATDISDFIRWAKANRIAVLATWPNTLYFKQYESDPAFAEIADFYRALGVDVVGMPEDAMVGPDMLADTIYHLTQRGIVGRTAKLIDNLKNTRGFSEWRKQAPP